MADVFLTPKQISEQYPVGLSAVYAACTHGGLAHYRLPAASGRPGKYLVRQSDFLAWLEGCRAGTPNPVTPPTATPGPVARPPRPRLQRLRLRP